MTEYWDDKQRKQMTFEIRPTKVYKVDMLEILKQIIYDTCRYRFPVGDYDVNHYSRGGISDAVFVKINKPCQPLWNYIKSRIKRRADYININCLHEADDNDWGGEYTLAGEFTEDIQVEINSLLDGKVYEDRDDCLRHLSEKKYDILVRQVNHWSRDFNEKFKVRPIPS